MGNKSTKPKESKQTDGTLLTFQQLINMGFDESVSFTAAQKYGSNINAAINFISKQPMTQKIQEAVKTEEKETSISSAQSISSSHNASSKHDSDLSCESIQRIIHILQIMNKGENDIDKFVEYIVSKYGEADPVTLLLNDYHHILLQHDKFLEELCDSILFNGKNCNVNKCVGIRRNQMNRFVFDDHMNDVKEDNPKNAFLTELVDQIHCHFSHTFDIGFRLRKSERKKIYDKCSEENEVYISIRELVAEKRRERALVMNKHHLKFGFNDGVNDQYESLYDALTEDNLLKMNHEQSAFNNFLRDNEYDTDSMQYDIVTQDVLQSNILNFMKNKLNATKINLQNHYQQITLFIQQHVDSEEEDINHGSIFYGTYNFSFDFNYYDEKDDLYITKKYDTLKEEILSKQSKISEVDRKMWDKSIAKAEEHSKTDYFKKLFDSENRRHPMTINHVLSLIFYCDYDELCYKFVETYRFIEEDHNEKGKLMLRHAHYYWFGKLLKETVLYYGTRYGREIYDRVQPLYRGLNQMMIFSSTVTTAFNQPTSTTTEITVAANFATYSGMILVINRIFASVPCFDCKFISKHANESELLFCGSDRGNQLLIFTNIIDCNTGKQYKNYLSALNKLIQMTIGNRDVYRVSDLDEKIINSLLMRCVKEQKQNPDWRAECLSHPLLQKPETVKFEPVLQYIHHVFDTWRMNKKIARFYWTNLYELKFFNKLFYHPGSYVNLENIYRYNLFPNLETIEVYDDWGVIVKDYNVEKLVKFTSSFRASRGGYWVKWKSFKQLVIMNISIYGASDFDELLNQGAWMCMKSDNVKYKVDGGNLYWIRDIQ
eukprot:265535_1